MSTRTKPKLSKVWEYFDEIEDAEKSMKSVCKICSVALSYHGTTSAMRVHLKRKHAVDLLEDG